MTTRCPACTAELTPLRKGGWFCEDCDRRFDAGLTQVERRAAPAVAAAPRPPRVAPAVAGVEPTTGENVLRTSASLPFLIAYPLERSRLATISAEERTDALLWASYQVVRLTGLLLLSDYLALPDECRKVNLAVRALRAPDWWGWTVLCNQLVRFWSGELEEKPSRGPRLPKVVSGWRSFNRKNANKKESKWATVLDGLSGRDGPAHSANDALWHAFDRQGRALGPGDRDTEAEQVALERLDRLVELSAHRLFPKDSVLLLRRAGEPQAARGVIQLHGHQADGRFKVVAPPASLPGGMGPVDSAAAVGDEVFPLYPMLLLFDSDRAKGAFPGGGLLEPLTLEGEGASAVGVLGGRGGQTPRLVGPAIDAFREKKVDMLARENEVSVAAVAPWSGVMLGGVLRQLRDRGYFPDFYVERAGVDDALEAALQAPGRAVLVVGPVGSGKTSLLTRLATRATRLGQASAGIDFLDDMSEPITSARRGGDVVVLLSGRGAYSMAMERSGPEMLADAAARKLGVKEKRFKSLADLCAALDEGGMRGEGRRLWLLLDGIDEAEHAPLLLQALDQFLPAVGRYPWLRVCVSVDDSTLRLQGAGGVFENLRFFAQFYHRDGKTLAPYLACRPFLLQGELAQAYARRSQRKGQAPMPPLEALNREALALPLHLFLFPVALPALPRAGGFDDEELFRAYFSAISRGKPRLGEALVQLGEAMLAHRSVDLLSAAVDKSRRAGKGGPPFAELVDAGLLLPPCDDGGDGEEAYLPATPALTREVLLSTLKLKNGGAWPDGEGLLGWVKELLGRSRRLDLSSPFVAAFALALETAVQRMVRAGHGDAVAALVEVEEDGLRQRLLTAALIAVGRGGREEEQATTALFSAASTPQAAARLASAAVSARRHLGAWGNHGAAAAVERFHLRMLRAQSASGATPELQEAQGRSMVELALLLSRGGQLDNARRYATDAVRVLKPLAGSGALVALGSALRLAGSLLPPERRLREGYSLLQEALAALRAAEANEPPNALLQAEVAAVLAALAEAAVAAGARDDAFSRLTALVQARRRLVAADAHRLDWQHELGRTLAQLADFELNAGGHAEARRNLDEASGILRGVVAREPRWLEAQLDLWRTQAALGNLARAQGMRGESLRLFEETLEGLRWLQSQELTRDDVRLDLAMALSRTGTLLVMEGKRTRARRLLEEAVGLLRDRGALPREPVALAELAASLTGLGNLARVEGKQTEARQHFHEATQLWESVAEGDPRPDSLAQLAQSLWSSSLVETDLPERRRYLERLQGVLDHVREGGPLSPSLARLAEMASRALVSL